MELEFVGKKTEAGDGVSFIFKPKNPISWQPGQYMDWEIEHPSPDERGTHHWFTISAAPHEDRLMLTTRLSPEGSTFKNALQALSPGQKIRSGLPRGAFILEDESRHYVLIAGGIGITPFRSMLSQLAHDGKDLKIDLLYLNSDEHLVFEEELEELQKKLPSFNLHKYIGRRIDKSDLEPFAKDPDSIFYLSGPRAMVESYQTMLEEMISADRVKTDYFPGY